MATRRDTADARAGFTLIELVAVVTLLATLAGIVMVSVSGHLHQARLVQTAERLESLDRRARDEARRTSLPVEIVWDRRESEARLDGVGGSMSNRVRAVKLSRLLELADVRLAGRRASDDRIAVSPNGQSPTYAVQLAAPNGARLWLVTLGMTGQHLRFETEEEMRALLEF